MMLQVILIRLSFVFFCLELSGLTDGQCAFPEQFIGKWKGADRGDMIFYNSTAIQQYSVNIPGVASFDFTCLEQRGSQYYLKAIQENNIFGVIVKFYMCWEMHGVDSDIGYYYQQTVFDPFLSDNIVGDGNSIATFDNVCTEPVVNHNFITLVKDGSIADGSLNISCPEDLQAQFVNVSIQRGSETEATMCPGTMFDVCTDRTLVNITYNDTCTTAPEQKTLSAGGIYRCIHAITDGSDTYLSIWNDDTLVANPFNCLAYTRTQDVIYATETPGFCQKGTNSSVAATSGTCEIIYPTTTEAPPNLSGLFALLIIPILLLLCFLILLARWCYRKYGCVCKKIKLPKRKKKEPPVVDDGTGMPDVVGNITFVPSVIKQPRLYNFRPKKQLDNFFPLFDPSWSVTDLYLQPVAKVEPLYADTLDDYMRGRLPRRPSGSSLYSFHSGRIANGSVNI